jgi:hypothetical protein
MTDRGAFGVGTKNDGLIARAPTLQLFALFSARNANRTDPESQALNGEAHRGREDRRISVLRRLNGECAERRNNVALWALHAACRHEERLRATRTKHVVSPCAVEVHVNVARDDQPLNATRT